MKLEIVLTVYNGILLVFQKCFMILKVGILTMDCYLLRSSAFVISVFLFNHAEKSWN